MTRMTRRISVVVAALALTLVRGPASVEAKSVVPIDKIQIHAKVYFEQGSTALGKESQVVLRSVADTLRQVRPITLVRVEGHTDYREEDKHRLSLARAEAVKRFLVGKGRVAAKRLTVAGYGDTRPVATNQTEAGRALNRRVSFWIVTIHGKPRP